MPIYEYQCAKCNRVSNFLVRNVATHRPPSCPKCGHPKMSRLLSRFAAVKPGKKSEAAASPAPSPGAGDAGMPPMPDISDAELESMEKNPREMGRLLRKMAEESGEPIPAEMNEVVRRLESGEDPEKIGELMDETGGGPAGGGDDTLYDG